MSTVKKGIIKPSGLWRKHFRRVFKRKFWSAERMAAKRLARREAEKVK